MHRAAKANTAAATRRHVKIAKGIPTTVIHIHFKTRPNVCQEWMKPFQAAVGIVMMLEYLLCVELRWMVVRLYPEPSQMGFEYIRDMSYDLLDSV